MPLITGIGQQGKLPFPLVIAALQPLDDRVAESISDSRGICEQMTNRHRPLRGPGEQIGFKQYPNSVSLRQPHKMAALGEDLLNIVNKLQDLVFNTIGNDSLDLPQIVHLPDKIFHNARS